VNKCGEIQAYKDIFKGKKILAAEDTEINREILSQMLEATGISIDFAVNGKAAVEMFAGNIKKYDLFLTDIYMPEMDGYKTARKLRAMEGGREIPIVAMTANVSRKDIDKCLDAGMNGHIGKPVKITELIEILKKFLIPNPY